MRVRLSVVLSVVLPVFLVLALSGCGDKNRTTDKGKTKQEPPRTTPAPETKTVEVKPADPFMPGVWVDLFDGKSLDRWKTAEFAGQGTPRVEKGLIVVPAGQMLSGVTSTRRDLHRMGYEIEVDAQKLEGNDFFCGLTFPVGESHASLVLGGWGGQICGISSLDYQDAASNDTTRSIEFKDKVWYHVRMRILPKRLQAWLDEELIVNANTGDRKVAIRIDMAASLPLGLATFQTTAAYKNIRVRRLTEEELNSKD